MQPVRFQIQWYDLYAFSEKAMLHNRKWETQYQYSFCKFEQESCCVFVDDLGLLVPSPLLTSLCF